MDFFANRIEILRAPPGVPKYVTELGLRFLKFTIPKTHNSVVPGKLDYCVLDMYYGCTLSVKWDSLRHLTVSSTSKSDVLHDGRV